MGNGGGGSRPADPVKEDANATAAGVAESSGTRRALPLGAAAAGVGTKAHMHILCWAGGRTSGVVVLSSLLAGPLLVRPTTGAQAWSGGQRCPSDGGDSTVDKTTPPPHRDSVRDRHGHTVCLPEERGECDV